MYKRRDLPPSSVRKEEKPHRRHSHGFTAAALGITKHCLREKPLLSWQRERGHALNAPSSWAAGPLIRNKIEVIEPFTCKREGIQGCGDWRKRSDEGFPASICFSDGKRRGQSSEARNVLGLSCCCYSADVKDSHILFLSSHRKSYEPTSGPYPDRCRPPPPCTTKALFFPPQRGAIPFASLIKKQGARQAWYDRLPCPFQLVAIREGLAPRPRHDTPSAPSAAGRRDATQSSPLFLSVSSPLVVTNFVLIP